MITGSIQTPVGIIPQVATKLQLKDYLGAMMVRWSINRDNYKVMPGLYAVGTPDASSDVFVSANYKLSFDHLRKNMDGLNAWILVLDTKGINVWCAAGKGTFGTKELVNRIKVTRLEEIINHRKIIVPQLGAVGVSAHKVKTETEGINSGASIISSNQQKKGNLNFSPASLKTNRGFNVIFGPIRAKDVKPFLNNNYKATTEMRKITFTFSERVRLIPVDFVYGKYKLLAAFAVIFFLSGINQTGISFHLSIDRGLTSVLNIFLAYAAGIIITPALLPYIPGRSFAFKGSVAGVALSLLLFYFHKLGNNYFEIISWLLILPGISSFLAMNFTGSSTYTSLSGVKKEMKIAIPLQITAAAAGLILFVVGKIV
jgi:hypothetical protein